MMRQPARITATLFSRLPADLHWQGEPNEWVRMTRPGMRLNAFLEGPCFDLEGNLWLVDVPYGRIFKIDRLKQWTLALAYDGEPHSIKRLQDGRFVLVDYRRGLLGFDATTASIRTIAQGHAGNPFFGLSDLALAPDGEIWFTDSGRSSLTSPYGRVYRSTIEGAVALVLDNVPYPNGIAVSPRGDLVYVAATRANQVLRLSSAKPASGLPMSGTYLQLSGGLGPDGLAVSDNGILAVAQAQAGRAYLFSELGDALAEVRLPEGLWTTSVAFDPQEPTSLYIVEAQTSSIYHADISNIQDAQT